MKKRFRTAVFLLLFAGIVLTVFRYFKLVSKTVYEESVSHLTEVFHQSDNMLRELTDKNRLIFICGGRICRRLPMKIKFVII